MHENHVKHVMQHGCPLRTSVLLLIGDTSVYQNTSHVNNVLSSTLVVDLGTLSFYFCSPKFDNTSADASRGELCESW